MTLRLQYLARQFARPQGLVGRFLIAPWLDRISREMRSAALDQLDIRRGDSVLETGFGGGALLEGLIAAGCDGVRGVDVSPELVERARRRFGTRAELYEAAAERLPLAASSVDKAVSLNSVYFWSDPEAAFAELARVLRPGGRLVLGFEPPEELAKWRGSRFGFRAYAANEVEEMLRAVGFVTFSCVEGRGRKPDRFLILSAALPRANGLGDGR